MTEQADGHAFRGGVEPLVGRHEHGAEVSGQQEVKRVVGRDSPFERGGQAALATILRLLRAVALFLRNNLKIVDSGIPSNRHRNA
ncbi:MAG: hypothetical protein WCC65_01980 [Pseudonocardiaceae bacterium]